MSSWTARIVSANLYSTSPSSFPILSRDIRDCALKKLFRNERKFYMSYKFIENNYK